MNVTFLLWTMAYWTRGPVLTEHVERFYTLGAALYRAGQLHAEGRVLAEPHIKSERRETFL